MAPRWSDTAAPRRFPEIGVLQILAVGSSLFALAGRSPRGHSRNVPRFTVRRVITSGSVVASRAVCDGCDPARRCDEHIERASLWLVTAGAFELRDRDGAHVLDPTHALVMPSGHGFVIRHPAGPDTCTAFQGPLIDRLAAQGSYLASLTAADSARLAAELAAWARGEGDELALGELLVMLAPPRHVAVQPDRTVVDAIAHVVRLHFAETCSLEQLAERAGYSVFHTCRVFRATTGQTIHGFRRELRLRHALARILDGDEPLVAIAAVAGFASQSHLTNLFHARFGVTPARARTRDGARQLAAVPG